MDRTGLRNRHCSRAAQFDLFGVRSYVQGRTTHAFFCFVLLPLPAFGQYKGDHIPGFLGLDAGTQAPPGIYVGDLLWVYPTSTIKDNNGNKINQRGSLTSTLDGILVSWVSNY